MCPPLASTPVLIMRRMLISAALILFYYSQPHVTFRHDIVLRCILSAYIQRWTQKHSVSFSSLPSDINTKLVVAGGTLHADATSHIVRFSVSTRALFTAVNRGLTA